MAGDGLGVTPASAGCSQGFQDGERAQEVSGGRQLAAELGKSCERLRRLLRADDGGTCKRRIHRTALL